MRLFTTFLTFSPKILFSTLVFAIGLFFAHASVAQSTTYNQGALRVDVVGSNPCDGLDNGSITFSIVSAAPGVTQVRILFISGPADPEDNYSLFPITPLIINVGSSYTFYGADNLGNALSTPALTAGNYDFFIREVSGANVINTTASHPPKVLTSLSPITITPTTNNKLNNTTCQNPLQAVLEIAIGGGSTSFPGGGSFNYNWSSTVTLPGMPKSGTISGLSPVLNLNSLLGIGGLPGATYTLIIDDNNSDCSQTIVQTVIDPSPLDFTTATSTPIVCAGDGGVITLSGSESIFVSPGVSYELYKKTGAGLFVTTGLTLAATGSALTFNISSSGLVASNTYTFQIIASNGFCTPRIMTGSPTITVNPLPDATFSGLASNYCVSNGPVTLAPTAPLPGGAFSGPGISGNTFDPSTAGVGGPYTIMYSVTDGNSCSNSTTQTVTVDPLPNATITAAGPFCITSSAVNLVAATTGGVWSGTGITNATSGTFNPATAGAGSHPITYTLTVGTCTSTDTKSIVVDASPNATITAAGPFCITASAVTLTAASPGGVWSGTGITNATLGTFDPATAGAGSHVITYSITSGSCTPSDSKTIVVDPLPNATITAAGPFCITSTPVNLVAATTGGVWSGTGITNVTSGTFNPATAGAGSHPITYTLTVGTCTSTDTKSIVVDASPNATITAAGPFCITASAVTLTAASPGGVWSGTGITNATLGTFDPATAGAGSHVITYSITSGSCTPSDSKTIVVDPLPNATITAAGPFCITSSAVNLVAATTGGVWSGTGITNVTSGTFNPATAGAGSHPITYTLTVGTCTSTDTKSIVVDASPNATITAAGPFCITASAVTLTAASPGGVWSGTGITNATLGTFDPATAGAGSHVITYSITSGSCTPSDSKTIVVDPLPNATITAAGPFCITSTPVNLVAATTGGVWSGTGITNVTSGTFNPATAGAGSHPITYTLTVGTCTSTDTKSIVVDASPNATITAAGPFCITASAVTLTAASPGGVWSGTGITNATLGTFDPATAGAGSHVITYSITSGSCTPSDSKTIVVNALPVATLSGPNNVCVNIPGNIYTTETGMTNYVWSVVGGTITSGGGTSNNTATVTWTTAGLENISVRYTNGACTSAITNYPVTVNSLGNENAIGSETWIAHVYDDNSVTVPPTSNINFPTSRYRGDLNDTEIGSLGFSTYNTTTDFFDFNTSNSVPIAGPNICGSYLDNYSIRFRMNKTFAAGVYTFRVGGDDGVQLKIDGALVSLGPAGSFNLHSYTTYTSVGVCLTAGVHAMEIEYYERGGFSRVSYSNQLANGPISTSPITVCVNSAIPTLTASSADPGVMSFKWYTDAALTNLVATTPAATPNYTPVPADLNMSVVATSDFYVTSVYACGQTTATKVDVTVVSGATINLPTPPVQLCKTGGIINLTTIVSATPAGGTFTFSGTGITTSPNFDPSLVASSSTISVSYSSGSCSTNTSFNIGVIAGATITVPSAPVALCQSAGNQDLTLLVSATPIGGLYTFSGPGVTGSTFDPTGQSGLVPILVNYTAGGCTDSKTFNYNMVSTASLTVDNTTSVCSSASKVDLTTLVSASPSGGTFTFTGTGVSGNLFDPSTGAAGTSSTINISYVQGGCATTGSVSIAIGSPSTLTANNTTKVCANSGAKVDLTTLVSASASGGVFTFSGTDVSGNFFDPVNSAGSAVVINVSYSKSGCSVIGSVIVNVRSATDTVCGAVGPPGGGPCSTVVITPSPSPATCNSSDGSISFGITPAIGAGLKIDVVGISTSNLGVSRTNFNDPLLKNLPRGTYNYTIEYGSSACIKTGQVTIGKIGGVADPVATNVIEPLCFGDASGSVKIDVAGETGNTLQWSLDAFATAGKNFVAGGQITGIPSGAAPGYQQTISVRKNAADLCFGGVAITMKGPVSKLDTLSTKKVISQPDLATGSLLVDIIESGQAPYEAKLELIQPLFTGQVFAQDWTVITRNTLNLKYEIDFTGLYAGNYLLSLRDGLGCVKTYSVVIKVDTEIQLPNIFTPNGDGVNEVFYIRNLPTDSYLIVTNRWGSEVYSSKNYQNDWNGGSTVDGVYYYKLSAAGQSYTGWLEILRGK